jgi:1,4-alpha-glucan branching enzyme
MARKNPNVKRQTFLITAPGAVSVMLAGDFTHWLQGAIPMQKQADGVWMASVELASGNYHYRFIVDGQWRDDPESTLRMPNPYGSQDSVRQVV